MDKFTVSVITIIDDYEDKLPYLYESLLLNTQNNINIIWNIYCNEGNEFGKNIIEYFEDLNKETNAGFLKVKTFYGELNRFDAEELLVKNSYGDFLINAETNTVFLGDAFKKLKDNAFMIEDIYGFAFLEKDMPKYINANKNIKYIDLNIKENKYNFPIFYNLEMRKQVSNRYPLSDVFNISRNCPNMVNFELDKKGYIFALNIPIMQKILEKENEIKKINKNEEKEEEILKKILENPVGFKNFYENIFSLGVEYFKNSKTKLKRHIDRYSYTMYILNKKPDLENILDNKMRRYILFRNFINQFKYKIKYKNKEEQKRKILYEEKEKLKERYLNLSKIDKLNNNLKLEKNNKSEAKIKLASNNIDIEKINDKGNKKNIIEEKNQVKDEELKKLDKEKTVVLNFKNDTKNNSDYNNYIRNMRMLKNGETLDFDKVKDKDLKRYESLSEDMEKTKIQKVVKNENELSFAEKLEMLEKSINEDLAEYEKYKKKYENNLEKEKTSKLAKEENIDFDLLLDKTALTKKLEKIKTNREENLEKLDISQNTVEVNLAILKKLEKEEERLLKEKQEEKKNRKKLEEEKRNKAWKEYINSHFNDEDDKIDEISLKEKVNENKELVKNENENKNKNQEKFKNDEENLEEKKLKCLNEDGTVKILDNLDEKKEKYLKIIKEKKQKEIKEEKEKKDLENISDYLFGEEFQ